MTRETELLDQWLENVTEEDLRAELLAMKDDEKAVIEAFHQDLEFGTGGLRGIMGAGTNRMNIYIVGMATQGIANYILKAFPRRQLSMLQRPDMISGHASREIPLW